MNSIAIFCGSSFGNNPNFISIAEQLGNTLAKNKIKLIYGGAQVGLMGTVANACLNAGGHVIGVLPRILQTKEIAHNSLNELILTDNMHQRKMKMFELAEGFIALPGGFGTLEEVSEILTWQQLGLHKFPIGILNIDGFYDHLEQQFDQMQKYELLKPENRSMAIFSNNLDSLLEKMKSYKAPDVPKWINKEST